MKQKTPESSLVRDLTGLGPFTVDDFLGGRVRLIQLKEGYRAGMDAVLLAASIPALAGDRALDLGAATGGVAICLGKRVAGVAVDGIEIQPDLVRVAEANITLNDLEGRVSVHHGSVGDIGLEAIPKNTYDHVFANPPYLEGDTAIPPPAKTKGIAHVGGDCTIGDWVKFALSRVKARGTLTFIFRADRMPDLCHLLYGKAGEIVIFPLWPRAGVVAKRVLVQARKGLAGVATITPGLALHGTAERYTVEAEEVLRAGRPIDLAQYHRAKKP